MAPPGELRGKGRCGVFAGKTVWSTPERFIGEVLTTRRYTNLRLPLPLPLPGQINSGRITTSTSARWYGCQQWSGIICRLLLVAKLLLPARDVTLWWIVQSDSLRGHVHTSRRLPLRQSVSVSHTLAIHHSTGRNLRSTQPVTKPSDSVWSPVSIQTQSLALRKRKPQETQALALASSQSWLPLLRPSIPIGWCLRLLRCGFRLRNARNASDCVWMETGLHTQTLKQKYTFNLHGSVFTISYYETSGQYSNNWCLLNVWNSLLSYTNFGSNKCFINIYLNFIVGSMQ